MCANTTELTYEALLADPLIHLVMQSDGVTHAQLVAVLRDAAKAVQTHAELLPLRPRLTLVHSAPPPPPQISETALEIRPTGT